MLFERALLNDEMEKVGVYFFDGESEREIYDIDGNLVDLPKLSTSEMNYVYNLIDSFDEGNNRIEVGYEVSGWIGVTAYTIKRKIEKVEMFK